MFFVAFSLVVTSTGPGGFMICAQTKVVLWRSRESNLRPLVYKTWVYPLHHGDVEAYRHVQHNS